MKDGAGAPNISSGFLKLMPIEILANACETKLKQHFFKFAHHDNGTADDLEQECQ